MKKVKKGKKISRNITLDEETHNYIVQTGKDENEKRNFSNMAEKLILEAKAMRLQNINQN